MTDPRWISEALVADCRYCDATGKKDGQPCQCCDGVGLRVIDNRVVGDDDGGDDDLDPDDLPQCPDHLPEGLTS